MPIKYTLKLDGRPLQAYVGHRQAVTAAARCAAILPGNYTLENDGPVNYEDARFIEQCAVQFPMITDARQLFTDMRPYDKARPGRTDNWISGYCAIKPGGALHVTPAPRLVAWIHANMLYITYDQLYFDIIIHDDGRALVTVKHNQIIGSRWLARIDATTLPTGK